MAALRMELGFCLALWQEDLFEVTECPDLEGEMHWKHRQSRPWRLEGTAGLKYCVYNLFTCLL